MIVGARAVWAELGADAAARADDHVAGCAANTDALGDNGGGVDRASSGGKLAVAVFCCVSWRAQQAIKRGEVAEAVNAVAEALAAAATAEAAGAPSA